MNFSAYFIGVLMLIAASHITADNEEDRCLKLTDESREEIQVILDRITLLIEELHEQHPNIYMRFIKLEMGRCLANEQMNKEIFLQVTLDNCEVKPKEYGNNTSNNNSQATRNTQSTSDAQTTSSSQETSNSESSSNSESTRNSQSTSEAQTTSSSQETSNSESTSNSKSSSNSQSTKKSQSTSEEKTSNSSQETSNAKTTSNSESTSNSKSSSNSQSTSNSETTSSSQSTGNTQMTSRSETNNKNHSNCNTQSTGNTETTTCENKTTEKQNDNTKQDQIDPETGMKMIPLPYPEEWVKTINDKAKMAPVSTEIDINVSDKGAKFIQALETTKLKIQPLLVFLRYAKDSNELQYMFL